MARTLIVSLLVAPIDPFSRNPNLIIKAQQHFEWQIAELCLPAYYGSHTPKGLGFRGP